MALEGPGPRGTGLVPSPCLSARGQMGQEDAAGIHLFSRSGNGSTEQPIPETVAVFNGIH